MVCTSQVNLDIAEYIARFNVALNLCSDVIDLEAKLLLKENLCAEEAVQLMKFQPSNPKDSQALAQRAGSILYYVCIFEHTKKGNKKGKKCKVLYAMVEFLQKKFILDIYWVNFQ